MITSFFINKKSLLYLIVAFFILGGIFSYSELKRNEDPGFKIRTASIITTMEGFSPEKIDRYVTRPIEYELLEMEEIEDIREESIKNKSIIYADLFEYYDEIQPIWDRLRRKVNLVELPDGANLIVNDEYKDVFGALIGITIENSEYEKLYDAAKLARDEFLKNKECAKAEIIGKQQEALYLKFKEQNLLNLKLTPEKIKKIIQSANIIGGGASIIGKNSEIDINSKNEIRGAKDLRNVIFNIDSTPISAGDIFNIEKTIKTPVSSLVRSNGKDALIIAISMKDNGNIIKWGAEILQTVEKLKGKYQNANFEILALQSEYVKTLIKKFTSSLFESILAVILIVFLILDLKMGLIIGFIILTTISSVFFMMNLLNIGLDKISLSALIISLGILVDNSVVIAQGIFRNLEKGITESIMISAKKFQTPLFVVTNCCILSFLPTFLAKSNVGEYASNLFKVIGITLFFSLFYSLTLLPVLILKFETDEIKKKRISIEFIKKGVDFSIKHSKFVTLFFVCAFLTSLVFFNFVPKVFFPNSDRNMYEIRLNLKNGVSLEETKNAAIKVEEYLKNKKEIKNFSTYVGTSAPRYVLSASPEADRKNFAMLLINTSKNANINNLISETKKYINKFLPDAESIVRKIPLGPPVDAPVEIRIFDEKIENLFVFAEKISSELSKIDGVYLVKNNWGDFVLEYNIKVNENAALLANVQPDSVFEYLDSIYNGKIISYYYRDDIKIPIILKGEENNLNSISLYSENYGIIPIAQIADVEKKFTYSKILRRNNSYVLTVQGWHDENTTADKVCRQIKNKLEKIPELKFEFGGTIEKSKKGNNSVIAKIPAAFGIIAFILVWYFNSIFIAFIIICCGVFALTGANLGLFITGQNFGFITFLGYIALVGICINNGVILLGELKNDTGIILDEEKIKNAAYSRIEAVLLTCLTTIGGMLPLWIKNDAMFSSLAVSIIFGLLSSISITLFFMPALFSFLNSRKKLQLFISTKNRIR